MAVVSVELSCGRPIRASSLHISETYSGLLEGLPSAQMNEFIIDTIRSRVQKIFSGDWPVELIDPIRRTEQRKNDRRSRPVEYLPRFWMASRFESLPIGSANHGSAAIVIWFQDDPMPCPGESALAELRRLDWTAIARDFEY